MITLRQLRYFEALSRHLHFGRAADACAVTQPALSMQIQELEEFLDVKLVERRRDGLVLTIEGEEIASRARSVLNEVRDMADYSRRTHGLAGELHLGVIPTVAPYLLPDLLPKLRDQYPNLNLRVRETLTDTLVHEILIGRLDVLLIAIPVTHSDLEAIELFDDPFLLAQPASEPAPKNRRIKRETLEDNRLLLLEEGHCFRDQTLEYCQMARTREHEIFGTSSLATLVQMVRNGMGITLLPELSLELEARHDDVQLLRFSDPEPKRTLGLAWRKTAPRKADYAKLAPVIIEVQKARAARARKKLK